MQGEATSNTLEDQIANFDPSNPESLAALEQVAMGDEGGVATEAKQDEKTPEQTTPVESAPSGAQADQTRGVQAKDGQHIIPYSVLERERDRAARAEATAQALAEQLQNLQNGKLPDQTSGKEQQGTLSDEDLEQLDSDLPGVAKVIRAQMAMIEKLTGNLQNVQREQEVVQQTRQQSIQDEIESAIQGNESIKSWREAASRQENPDPLMWSRAVEVDKMLRQDPAWQDRSIAERFSKVSDMVNAFFGTQQAGKAPEKQIQQPSLQQAAEAALKAAPAPMPETLSDIPGGTPPAQTDIETLQNASVTALGNKFMSMTPEQMESYLARMAA